MVRKKNRILALICAVMMLFSVTTAASALELSPYSSAQISSHRITVTPLDNGQIKIKCEVYGTGVMDKLGTDHITIYEAQGTGWLIADDYSGDYKTSSATYSGNYYFSGVPGTRYKIVAGVFATDSAGTDTEYETYIVTAKS